MKKTDPTPDTPAWNHNTHYHRVVLDSVPTEAASALDVGTGDGLLAVDLRERISDVTGLDADHAVLETARARADAITWIEGDVMTYDFGRTFDVVASIATLHQLPDLPGALTRLAELTAPGGVVVVIGLGRTSRPSEIVLHLVGAVQHRWFSWRRGFWEHSAPKRFTVPLTYTEVQHAARTALPGCRFRRLPLWRYSVIWEKAGPH